MVDPPINKSDAKKQIKSTIKGRMGVFANLAALKGKTLKMPDDAQDRLDAITGKLCKD